MHGFADASDYYNRSSSLQFLPAIEVPTLLLAAGDDPFYPPGLLDLVRSRVSGNRSLTLELVRRGGHVGFVEGSVPWRSHSYVERRIASFAERVLADVSGQDRSGTR